MRYTRFKRYQINKKATRGVAKKHPWIFSGNLSSAAESFQDGEYLKLYDGENNLLAFGILSKDEKIAVRLFHFGETLKNRFFFKKLRDIWSKKEKLCDETNAIRYVNGECDQLPGLFVDLYNDVAVVSYASPSLYRMARLIAFLLPQVLPEHLSKHILVRGKPCNGSRIDFKPARWVRGQAQEKVEIFETKNKFEVYPNNPQSSGFFMDLRAARRELSKHDFNGMRVLNLFSYTGAFSVLLQKLGAREVVSVESNRAAIQLHNNNIKLNDLDPAGQEIVCADVHQYLSKLDDSEKFDFIIFDPTSMTSSKNRLNQALQKHSVYHKLALKHLNPESLWLSCCRSHHVPKAELLKVIGQASKEIIGKGNTQIVVEIKEDIDFSVPGNFSEGHYLKQVLFSNFKL
ncbi:MAG: class I SAM-dependent rRNA methyltransferase [Candidatus Cloacimonetes bacterium]|nr:class I SAM-dependent rRNA methyltransferase [Candidatus Cloacimonadota bacterium]